MVMPRKSLEPWLKDEVQYYEHQITGVRRAARMRNFLLADDMGLGKSLQALTVATIDIITSRASSIIVICPVTLRGNWADEIEKFTRLQYVMLGQIVDSHGKNKKLTPAKRSEQLASFAAMNGPKVLITNYEQIGSHLEELNDIGFDIKILDEAHYIKSHKSKRSKNAHKLKAKRAFLLTGTPMLNQVNELWSLLHMIDKDAYPKYWTFLQRYAVYGGFKDKQIIGVKNEKELTERLQSVMIRRLKSEVLDLPEIQIVQRKVELTDQQRKIYDHAFENLEIQIGDDSDPVEIENALTKFLRLKQICGTTLPFTGEDHSSKLDLAVEDSLELMGNGHKIVVFTQFRAVLEAFCQRLDRADDRFDIWELHGDVKKEDRRDVVNEWAKSQEPAALACMLQVAGVGLNMTEARHALFIDKLFTPGMNQQAVDRLHRIGQSESQPVQILEYICRKTIENRVEQILTTKKKLFDNIVNEPDFKRRLIQALMNKEDDD